mmetsp:Transcript_668/g.1630  ORF Transcript_668/g.1630 Transcript_668/m.1630 type:complete len:288 (+) Transcript_668:3417-4280(+)
MLNMQMTGCLTVLSSEVCACLDCHYHHGLQLWDHLQRIAMPSLLLQAIKEMYQDDEYILMDGDKRASVRPTNGVKQGCPLSPLLFSLYINDMGRDISEGIRGAVTGDGVNGVSYMLYADDLSLTTNDPGEMQVMLNRLRAYAMRKGLTVNTSKSEVIHFNSRSCSSLPTFMYGDVVLPEKEQCKYLGTLVDKHINLKVHEKHTVRPYMASQQRIKEFAHEHDLKNREAPLLCKGLMQNGKFFSSQVDSLPSVAFFNLNVKVIFIKILVHCCPAFSWQAILRPYSEPV